MSKAPSMPMYWDAYLADTTHLTTEEHGAYMLLLGAMWRRNGWVPDDDRDNARILGLTVGKWRKIKARLSDFLMFQGGEISQKKLLETWEKTQEKIEKNRSNGAKGGRPKVSKNKGLEKANASVSVNPNQTIPEPEPEIKREAKASPKKRGSRLPQDWALPVAWGNWALGEGWPEPAVRSEADKFRDYWHSVAGQKGVKLDWLATWRNWMRNSKNPRIINGGQNEHSPRHPNRLQRIVTAAAEGTSGQDWG
ncbi:DUF1376 domain-containing protein [Pseudophaeobacter sp.]|uniref:YdaU family protein n=1 Tax=Pseudophaeobacter sp. TaxID=1971739 RepID=UPI003298B8DE